MGVALLLAAVTLLTRAPFLTEHLYEHDSVLYARAVEAFDPADHRPHPPGYLWYVLLIRAATAVAGDANTAMTWISALASAAAVALLYALGARLYDEWTGRVAALFLLTSVTFWARGIVAYPYTLLAALTILLALLLWRAIDRAVPPGRRGRRLLIASAAWGLAIGFRPDLALAIAPLWLLAALASSAHLAYVIAAAGTAAALVGAWILASGLASPSGLTGFLGAVREQSQFIEESSGVGAEGARALRQNALDLARYLGRALYALAPLVLVAALWPSIRRVELRDARRVAFLLIWTFAPLPVFLLYHVGEYGHVFTMLPGLMLLAARAAIGLADAVPLRRLTPIAGAVIVANAGIFLLSDTPLSARDIDRRDRGIAEKAAWIRANVHPERAVIATLYDQVIIEHYLGRDFRIVRYEIDDGKNGPTCAEPGACPSDLLVVAWDDLMELDSAWTSVAMPHGSLLRVSEMPVGSALRSREGRRLRVLR